MQGGGLADGSERVYGFGADQVHRFAAQPVMTTTAQLFVWCTVAVAVAHSAREACSKACRSLAARETERCASIQLSAFCERLRLSESL